MSFPRYPKYKDSGVAWLGEVPEHWEVVPLKRIAALISGDGITGDSIDETGECPVLGGNGLRGYTSAFTHEGHYVVIGRQGALCGNINYAKGKFWASEHAVVATPLKEVKTLWLGEMLRAMNLNQYSVSAAQPGLSMELVGNLRTVFPPLSDQHAIAAFLDRETAKIDGLVGEQRRLIELLKEKRQAVISHVVTKGLNPHAPMKPSGIEWLGDVPAHWTVMPIRYAARLESGHTPSRSRPDWWTNCKYPWISLSDVWQVRGGTSKYIIETKEKISELGLANSAARLLPKGTVILSRTASVGFSGIMGSEMATTQDFANWVCGSRLVPEYLLYVFRSMGGEFERLKYGSTHNTIYMPDIAAMRFALPPKEEQQAIVLAIDHEIAEFDAFIAQAQKAADLLQERRTALISAAVTGKIDVRGLVPSFEPTPETVGAV